MISILITINYDHHYLISLHETWGGGVVTGCRGVRGISEAQSRKGRKRSASEEVWECERWWRADREVGKLGKMFATLRLFCLTPTWRYDRPTIQRNDIGLFVYHSPLSEEKDSLKIQLRFLFLCWSFLSSLPYKN